MATRTDLKPIRLWGKGGPNPPKVEIIMLELGIPHEITPVPYSDVKNPEFTAINPNGRLPAIHDPNTGLTLWESGAIVEYIIETYDKDHKLSFPAGTPEVWHARQWLFFQTTGQGPYFGQAAWFALAHPEKLPSALKRFTDEVRRVSGVLDAWLSKQRKEYSDDLGDGPWLVGNRISYADISFLPWQLFVPATLGDLYSDEDFPELRAWMDKMKARPTVAPLVPSITKMGG
ncbi:glutathione S-transferase [Echria macrotheca]|uniref:Glutathione S-transferase n=1 Tax=Echria macrotheca TaxID=438768 RepID=A0AAJ0BBT9_9PEZI|nr:glutathione S-transferase [Echria macrotheca]